VAIIREDILSAIGEMPGFSKREEKISVQEQIVQPGCHGH
jgi:hypothetical protein